MAKKTWTDDDWWDYREFMNQKTMDMWVPKSIAMMILIPGEESEDGLPYYELDPERLQDMHEAAKELIILQTREWSFGEVTLDVLNQEIRPEYISDMSDVIAGVVPPLGEMSERTLQRLYSSRSPGGDQSPENSPTPPAST